MITENRETLRQKSDNFEGTKEELDEVFSILEFELKVTQSKGVGLSGIQISYPYRVSIIRTETLTLNLYNAKIIHKSQPFTFKQEGCLSLPNHLCDTTRFNLIEVENGDGTIHKLSGFNAVVVQHELDHHEGILFIDRAIAKGVNDEKNTNVTNNLNLHKC